MVNKTLPDCGHIKAFLVENQTDGRISKGLAGSAQSMAGRPCYVRKRLAHEKCRQPKKPLWADNGEEWTVFNTK